MLGRSRARQARCRSASPAGTAWSVRARMPVVGAGASRSQAIREIPATRAIQAVETIRRTFRTPVIPIRVILEVTTAVMVQVATAVTI